MCEYKVIKITFGPKNKEVRIGSYFHVTLYILSC
jgi:hypothetical protein